MLLWTLFQLGIIVSRLPLWFDPALMDNIANTIIDMYVSNVAIVIIFIHRYGISWRSDVLETVIYLLMGYR